MTVVVAQLGCGYWGPNILRNLVSAPGCRVKTVVEPNPDRRRFVADRFAGVAVSDRAETALHDPEVDAVVIVTPASTHAELARAALECGKHVLVEKPLAMTVAEVDAIAAVRGDRVVMVGHTFLYNDAVRYLKRLIDGGELGERIHYAASERLNLGQVRSDVDAWWNLAPHDVSILLHLFDGAAPERVMADGLSCLQPGIADVAFAQMHWADGRAAHIRVSWLDPGKSRRMTIVGSRRMVVYDDIAENKISILDKGVDFAPRIGERMDFDAADAPRPIHRFGDILLPHVVVREPLKVEVEHFLDCVRTGAPPLTGLDHARRVVAVLEAGALSMAEGASRPTLLA